MKMSVAPLKGCSSPDAGGGLQQAQRRGADGDDAPAARAHGVERRRRLGGNLAALEVHLVVGGVVGLHRQERAGADVQRHEVARDAARIQRRHQLRREVQARRSARRRRRRAPHRWSGSRRGRPSSTARRPAMYGGSGIWPTAAIAASRSGPDRSKAISTSPASPRAADGRVERAGKAHAAVVAEVQPVALLQALGRPRQRPPAVGVEPLDQRHRDVGGKVAAPAHALQRRRNDARVVEHQRVAFAQQRRQIAHAAIGERRLARRHDEQPRRIARAHRMQRDALLRQLEIEQIGAHQ